MKLVIRQYHPSDNNEVLTLVSCGVLEHISPCFYSAITCPLYVTITLTLCAAGYLLSSMLGAVVLPGAWVGLVYYCCHETSASSARLRLKEIRDIPGSYLGKPDDCFWVAEAEVEARAQIVGVVAVEGKHSGKERYGELCKLTVSPSYRRVGLGSRLVQTVVNFCKERGFSKVELNTSSTRTASLALYKKLGFSVVLLYTKKNMPYLGCKVGQG